jgi:hypothetical protein
MGKKEREFNGISTAKKWEIHFFGRKKGREVLYRVWWERKEEDED